MKNTFICMLALGGCGHDADVRSPVTTVDSRPHACAFQSAEGDIVARYYEVAKRGLWCGAESDRVRGLVVDIRGRAIEGARVTLTGRDDASVEARTDAAGWFRFEDAPPQLNGVIVESESMNRHAYHVSRWQGVYFARLVAELTPELIESVTDARDAEREWKLLEILAAKTGLADDAEAVLWPRLGGLRDALRALVDAGAFAEPDDRAFSPATRARRLLALWWDDRDEEINEGWLEHFRFARRPDQEVRGDTLDALCRRFADVHFEREGVETRTWHACSEPVLDPAGTRAWITFQVRYANWGYTTLLVAHRDDARWRVIFEHEGRRDHYR